MNRVDGKFWPLAEPGFTLIELLMTIALSAIVVSALFFTLNECQKLGHDLHELAIRNQNMVLAPLILTQLIPSAGNALSAGEESHLEIDDSTIYWRQDIDGENGFPNGRLTESYEQCGLRRREQYLQLRSGRGSYQSFVRQISDFQVSNQVESVLLSIKGHTDTLLLSRAPLFTGLDLRVHLWSARASLFARRDE